VKKNNSFRNLKELAINLEIHSFNGFEKEITSSGISVEHIIDSTSAELKTVKGIFRKC
jgi:hypothetical protein